MRGPLITMSAITGKPTKSDIYEYLSSLKANGINEAMLYPRSGCEIEYLSEEWFDTIGNFIESARMLDMYIWLYDDFNWPSGDAGGRVTAIPEYRLRAISTKGESIGQISYKSLHNSGLFGEKFFPDLLSYDAVDCFIKCTHEEYYKRFKKAFGTVIKGIFTDEPSIGYCCQDEYIPYYDGIEEDYFTFCGRDFNEDMRSFNEDFYLNAITVISNRFRACYIDKICSWCKEHGILMTGHLMCDNEPFWTTKHNGKLLKNLSHFLLPGIDEIETKLDDRTEMALLGVIEYASGENGAMAELFALGPCDMSYAKRRVTLYLSACHKIDHYFLAISHMDMRGNMLVKDYFSNFSTDQPDFAGMKELALDAQNAALLAKKDYTPDVYIRYPFSVSAKHITENLDLTVLFNLINELTYKQIQWKFIDDERPDAPIIELNDNLELVLDGKKFDISSISTSPLVTDKKGEAPKGIFVRKFNDGSFVVLNLFAEEGEYFIDGKMVLLHKHAVHFSSTENDTSKTEELLSKFDVGYKNDNIIRTMYVNSQINAEIYCENDTEVIFAIRKDTEAFLSGKKIICQEKASTLPSGMKKLYKISEKTLLKKGANIISSKNDFKYLPSVLVIGDFKCETQSSEICTLKLSKRVDTYSNGEEISDYGIVEFTTDTIVPYGAKAIELYGTKLFTQIYANEKILGEKIVSPYIFNIDKSLWNKRISLKITQYSSIAPIFGNVAYWDKNVEECGWRGTASPKQQPFGFDKICWIF